MSENNVYIIALKYGTDNLDNEVTYNKLLAYLEAKKINLSDDLKRYFHVWFYENFYVDSIYPKIKDFSWGSGDLSEEVLSRYDNKKAILTGSAHQTYQDYQELKFAYQSAKEASKWARIAIWITAIIGLIQIIISLSSA